MLHKFCLGLALLFAALGAAIIIYCFAAGASATGVPLGLILFLLAWIAWRVVKEDREAKGEQLVGIGGWLIVLAIGQIFGLVSFLGSVFSVYSSAEGATVTNSSIALYTQGILNGLLLAIFATTTYLFFIKSRLFPRFFIVTYAVVILLYSFIAIPSADPQLIGGWIASIVGGAIWLPYIVLSKRVANTFFARSA